MLYVLKGGNSLDISEFIRIKEQELNTTRVNVNHIDLHRFFYLDMFGVPALYCFDLEESLDQAVIDNLINSKNYFIARVTNNKLSMKAFANHSQVFEPPTLLELPSFIKSLLDKHGASYDPLVPELISKMLYGEGGGFRDPVVNVEFVSNEVRKLVIGLNNNLIVADVVKLLSPYYSPSIFDLTSALDSYDKKKFFNSLNGFFGGLRSSDIAGEVILVNFVLADYFRNLLIISKNLPESELLTITGWKKGRIYILQKNFKKFGINKIKNALTKFEALDLEVKNSHPNPLAILTLICASLFD